MRILKFTIFFLLVCSSAQAKSPDNIGSKYNSSTGSFDYCLKVGTEDGTVVDERCKEIKVSDGNFTDEGSFYLLRAGLSTYGYTSMTTSQTAVPISYSLIRKEIASDPAFSLGTLANGKRGQLLTIQITVVQGTGTFTLTPTKATGFTSLVFETVGDLITLLYANDAIGWIPINQESVQFLP